MANNSFGKRKKPVNSEACKRAIAKALKQGWLDIAVAVACYECLYNQNVGASVARIADLFLECGYATPFTQVKQMLDELVARGLLTVKTVDD